MRARLTASLATVASIPVLYFVVRAAAVSLAPAATLSLPPHNPAPLLRPLVFASALPDQPLRGDVIALSRQAAASAPLAYEPFFIEAKAAEQEGRLGRAIALLEEARRRRPTSLVNRLQLASYYGLVRRYPDMLREIDYVLEVNNEARRHVLPELAKLISDPAGRQALADLLSEDQDWRNDFFAIARREQFRPADTLALLNLMRERKPENELAEERELYLASLLGAGEYRAARDLWLSSMSRSERGRHQLLFNGEFRNIDAGESFGWRLASVDVGRAEIVPGDRPHLDVHYFGGRDIGLAAQTLALAPGRYRLRYFLRRDGEYSSGRFFWLLTCLPTERVLMRSELPPPASTFSPVQASFSVPSENCGGQKLSLIAVPGDVSAAVNVEIANMALNRVN